MENYYDEERRVSKQNYGEGYFEFKYDKIGNTENGFPIYNTRVRLKNESNIILMHNEQGLVIEHTSFVSSSSSHPEDLTKISLYSDSALLHDYFKSFFVNVLVLEINANSHNFILYHLANMR